MKYLSALVWILLPTVMFGGYALLTRIAEGATSQELVLFRAGHAHAGILLLLPRNGVSRFGGRYASIRQAIGLPG